MSIRRRVSRRELLAAAGAGLASLGLAGQAAYGKDPESEEKLPSGIEIEAGKEPTDEQKKKGEEQADAAKNKPVTGKAPMKREGLVTLRGNNLYFADGKFHWWDGLFGLTYCSHLRHWSVEPRKLVEAKHRGRCPDGRPKWDITIDPDA
jgi:hypothetical protein